MPRKKRVEKAKVEEDEYAPDKSAEVRLIGPRMDEVEVKSVVADEPEDEKPIVAESPKETKPSDMVKVKVLAGTLGWSEGFYEKGEIFEISKEDLKRFDPRYYQIIE